MISRSSIRDALDGYPHVSPWARWNLRLNPFGEPPAAELPDLIVAEIEGHAEWARRPRHAVHVVGDKGRGKSARLAAIHQRLPEFPLVYLAEDEPLPALPRAGGLLLDEAQRLPRRRRRQLFAQLEHLVLTSHEDHRGELLAAGWKVRAVRVRGLGADRLVALLQRRLNWAWNGTPPVPQVPSSVVDGLLSRHGDDIRAMLDELYERLQRAVHGTDLWEGRHGQV